MLAKADGKSYQERFCEDLSKHIKVLTQVAKMLEALTVGESYDHTKLPTFSKKPFNLEPFFWLRFGSHRGGHGTP